VQAARCRLPKEKVSAATNIAGKGASPEQVEAMMIANKKMYDAVRANPSEFSTPFLLFWLERRRSWNDIPRNRIETRYPELGKVAK
jgi:hypothetical protein